MCRGRSGGSWSGKTWHGAQEKQRPQLCLLHYTLFEELFGSVWTLPLSKLQQIVKKKKNESQISWVWRGTDSDWCRKVMPLCLCVVRREGKVCCLRWCAFVQSGTVSVQLHPWFGLVALESTSAVQWMERQSLFLCLCQRSLLCFEPKEPSSCSNRSPPSPWPFSPTLVFRHPSPPPFPTAAGCPCVRDFFELQTCVKFGMSSYLNNNFFQSS